MQWRKGLAATAVALFFGLTVLPAVGLTATSSREASPPSDVCPAGKDINGRETLTVTVDEYRPDGTVVTRQVSCSMDDAERLDQALRGANGIEEIFRVLAYRGIISIEEARDLTAALRERIDNADANMAGIWLPPLSVVFFSEVSTTFRWGGTVRVGMTPFLRLINRFLVSNLQRGVDVIDLCWGLRGSLYTRGLLGEHRLLLRPGMVCLMGFIGYGVHIPLLRHSFYGSAVMTVAAGLGEHDFDPWFPN